MKNICCNHCGGTKDKYVTKVGTDIYSCGTCNMFVSSTISAWPRCDRCWKSNHNIRVIDVGSDAVDFGCEGCSVKIICYVDKPLVDCTDDGTNYMKVTYTRYERKEDFPMIYYCGNCDGVMDDSGYSINGNAIKECKYCIAKAKKEINSWPMCSHCKHQVTILNQITNAWADFACVKCWKYTLIRI